MWWIKNLLLKPVMVQISSNSSVTVPYSVISISSNLSIIFSHPLSLRRHPRRFLVVVGVLLEPGPAPIELRRGEGVELGSVCVASVVRHLDLLSVSPGARLPGLRFVVAGFRSVEEYSTRGVLSEVLSEVLKREKT
jgi:hypothetical protein